MRQSQETVHATTVAIGGKGVLIVGPSGSGKSALALQLLALGAGLVADDQTVLTCVDERLIASAPDAIKGQIEARGVGMIPVVPNAPVPLHIVVDMGKTEDARLPKPHVHSVLDITLPCLYKADTPYFASALLLYVQGNAKSVP